MLTKQNLNIFLSYSWADNLIADQFDSGIRSFGIELIRDIRDGIYRTSVKEFMQRVKYSDFVIVLLSESFLYSSNCMFEMLELFKIPDAKSRVLPITVGKLNIFDTKERLSYYDYWDGKITETEQNLIKYKSTDLSNELKHYKKVRNELPELLEIISDMFIISVEAIINEDFKQLMKVIGIDNYDLYVLCTKIENIYDRREQSLRIDELLNLNRDNYIVLYFKAKIYQKNNEFQSAADFYERSLSYNPNFFEGLYYYAIMLLEEKKDYKLSRYYLERALKLNVDSPGCFTYYATLLGFYCGEIEVAKIYFQKAVDLDKYSAFIYKSYAEFYKYVLSDSKNALKYYLLSVEIDPEDFSIHQKIGYLAWDLKDEKTANKHYKKAISLNESNTMLLCDFARFLWDTNKINLAKKYYLKAVKLDSRSPFILTDYGRFLELELNDFEYAKKIYERATRVDRPWGPAFIYYAKLLFNHFNEKDEAIKNYKLGVMYDSETKDLVFEKQLDINYL